MYTINVKAIQNTEIFPVRKYAYVFGKRQRFKQRMEKYDRKLSRTGKPVEYGYESPRIRVLHPTKGWRDANAELIQFGKRGI